MKNDEKPTPKERILVGEELFKKMISFINRNHYELLWTSIYPKGENFPYGKQFRLSNGKEFFNVIYLFMDLNKCSNFEPWIHVMANKEYNNETIIMEGCESIKNMTFYAINKDEIFECRDYTIDCRNVVCSYNEFLEMINK